MVSRGYLKYGDISVDSLGKLSGSNSDSAGKVASVLFPLLKSAESSDGLSTNDSSFFAAAVQEEINARVRILT